MKRWGVWVLVGLWATAAMLAIVVGSSLGVDIRAFMGAPEIGEGSLYPRQRAALPFHDGESVSWLSPGARVSRTVTFRRSRSEALSYEAADLVFGSVRLFPVQTTAADDYIVEKEMVGDDGPLYEYTYVVRSGDQYRESDQCQVGRYTVSCVQ
ncbi:MAG: hypothetical protein QM759_02185 [Terricaulis sp.]